MLILNKFVKKILVLIIENKYLILLILIAILTHLKWFDLNTSLFYGDWRNWPDENVKRFIYGGYGTYFDDRNFGAQNIQIYSNFFFFLWGIIGSYSVATKLTLLMPIPCSRITDNISFGRPK